MAPAHLSFNLPVIITKLGKRFVAYTPALDISTSGKTARDAQKNFTELAYLFFEEIGEAGTTDEVLHELGWSKQRKQWTPPTVVSSSALGIRIPAFA